MAERQRAAQSLAKIKAEQEQESKEKELIKAVKAKEKELMKKGKLFKVKIRNGYAYTTDLHKYDNLDDIAII